MRSFSVTALSVLSALLFSSLPSVSAVSPFSTPVPDASFFTTTDPNPNLIPIRAPAYPLIVMSPTISVWSMANNLTDDYSRHWAGAVNDFRGMIKIDGTAYTWWGVPGLCKAARPESASDSDPTPPGCTAAPLQQLSVVVQPTQTFYTFGNSAVSLRVAFTTPAFPNDLKAMAKPWTYISFVVTPLDGKNHTVSIYLDHTAEVTMQDNGQNVWWKDVSSKFSTGIQNLHAIQMGSYLQIPFNRWGDGERNDWGYSYFMAQGANVQHTVSDNDSARRSFVQSNPLPPWDIRVPRACNDAWPVAAITWDFGTIQSAPVNAYAVFAYDDGYSMNYFHDYQRPYWFELYSGDVIAMLQDSILSYPQLMSDSDAYDTNLLASLGAASSTKSYATLCSLVHRQATGASVVTWNDKLQEPWVYLKEISSDGDVSTVDVVYPAAPIFLTQGPEMLRRMLLPLLSYGNNETDVPYRLNWAPHHLGTWPVCHLDAEEQEQMPVEESANMLIMLAGIAQKQNHDVSYLAPYWALLEQWNGFLAANLPDPDNQLCTDDFEGPSPHNVNLAIKGTLGMAAYSLLLTYKGDSTNANIVMKQAQAFAAQIVTNAQTPTGDHLRMQFDLPTSWSQKYNLVWQYILDVQLYPDSVANSEVTYYLQQATHWGYPLDNRHPYTKADWSSWSAAMGRNATQADATFDYMYNWANEEVTRVPYGDWYQVDTPRVVGFQARPVLGGLYARLLDVESRKMREAKAQEVVQM